MRLIDSLVASFLRIFVDLKLVGILIFGWFNFDLQIYYVI
jgi:hypothetical protein